MLKNFQSLFCSWLYGNTFLGWNKEAENMFVIIFIEVTMRDKGVQENG